jgi:hypothetical protein
MRGLRAGPNCHALFVVEKSVLFFHLGSAEEGDLMYNFRKRLQFCYDKKSFLNKTSQAKRNYPLGTKLCIQRLNRVASRDVMQPPRSLLW